MYRISTDLGEGQDTEDLPPHKHAIVCQYWASTGPMLTASAQYQPSTGTYRHVYRAVPFEIRFRRYGLRALIDCTSKCYNSCAKPKIRCARTYIRACHPIQHMGTNLTPIRPHVGESYSGRVLTVTKTPSAVQ